VALSSTVQHCSCWWDLYSVLYRIPRSLSLAQRYLLQFYYLLFKLVNNPLLTFIDNFDSICSCCIVVDQDTVRANGEAASQKKKGQTSIAWIKERISQHYTTAKEMEADKGKQAILPPAPKKSFLNSAQNRLSRTIAQIRTGHWVCGPYCRPIRKNRDQPVSDRCWLCGQWRMSRTHVVLRCMHPSLENA
jgi:hypothetical protein